MYELRHYVPAPGKHAELRRRFADGTLQLFEKLGIKVTHFWETRGESGDLYYVVEWPDEAAMKSGWEAFRSHEEWQRLKAATEANGSLTQAVTSIVLYDVDFHYRTDSGRTSRPD